MSNPIERFDELLESMEVGQRLSLADGLSVRRRVGNVYLFLYRANLTNGERKEYKLGTTDEITIGAAQEWAKALSELKTDVDRMSALLELRASLGPSVELDEEPEPERAVPVKHRPRPDLGLDWTPDPDYWLVQGRKTLITGRQHIIELLGSPVITGTIGGFRCAYNKVTGYGFALQPNRTPKYPTYGRRVVREDHWFEEQVVIRERIRDRKRNGGLSGEDIV